MSISSRMINDGLKTVNRASESRYSSNRIFRQARNEALASMKRSTVSDLLDSMATDQVVDLRDKATAAAG